MKGRNCPPTRTYSPSRRAEDLTHLFKGDKLAPGATIVLTITAPGSVGRIITWTIRVDKPPVTKVQCLPPGNAKPLPCTNHN